MTNVYIIHGYQADSQSHWFQWLKSSLELEGHDVEVLDLPNSDEPVLEDWLAYMERHILDVNDETIFIAHSLGVVTTLRFLEKLPQDSLGKMAIVSGFNEKIEDLPKLDEFIDENMDYNSLRQRLSQVFAIAAKDDPTVPFEKTKRLSEHLKGKFYEFDEGGHFTEEDGFDSFLFLKQKVVKQFD
ncbi:RBBP9/YdeN family alpha/beta hydrolase [Staphylococcus canis]|uniref:Serine hydrolase family protein n=1 Tax=Staphylococcus canis TaxID=2724942 RepID=A0ABS0TB79_9STAP|nr:alpha/beta hydrolase [Staphylococcus canis]MBI5975800.1 serine hydrolase family protein [Staphylococcus canis]